MLKRLRSRLTHCCFSKCLTIQQMRCRWFFRSPFERLLINNRQKLVIVSAGDQSDPDALLRVWHLTDWPQWYFKQRSLVSLWLWLESKAVKVCCSFSMIFWPQPSIPAIYNSTRPTHFLNGSALWRAQYYREESVRNGFGTRCARIWLKQAGSWVTSANNKQCCQQHILRGLPVGILCRL